MDSQAGVRFPESLCSELLLPGQQEDTGTGVPEPEWEGEELPQGLTLALSDLPFPKRRRVTGSIPPRRDPLCLL